MDLRSMKAPLMAILRIHELTEIAGLPRDPGSVYSGR